MLRFTVFLVALGAARAWGAEYVSENFVTTDATRELAGKLGKKAEAARSELLDLWFPNAKREWHQRCDIEIVTSEKAERLAFDQDMKTGRMKLVIRVDSEEKMDSALREGVSHAIFSAHYPVVLPPWIEKGTALLGRSTSERRELENEIHRRIVKREVRDIWLVLMWEPEDHVKYAPSDAECYSIVKFLLTQQKRKRFVSYVQDLLQRDRWKAMQSHYGYRDEDELNAAWKTWLLDEALKASR